LNENFLNGLVRADFELSNIPERTQP